MLCVYVCACMYAYVCVCVHVFIQVQACVYRGQKTTSGVILMNGIHLLRGKDSQVQEVYQLG